MNFVELPGDQEFAIRLQGRAVHFAVGETPGVEGRIEGPAGLECRHGGSCSYSHGQSQDQNCRKSRDSGAPPASFTTNNGDFGEIHGTHIAQQ
jgi:hypothetical protein